jgi:hypothetical protein
MQDINHSGSLATGKRMGFQFSTFKWLRNNDLFPNKIWTQQLVYSYSWALFTKLLSTWKN